MGKGLLQGRLEGDFLARMCGEVIQKPLVSGKDFRPFNPPQSAATEVVLPHAHADQHQQRGLPVVWLKVRFV